MPLRWRSFAPPVITSGHEVCERNKGRRPEVEGAVPASVTFSRRSCVYLSTTAVWVAPWPCSPRKPNVLATVLQDAEGDDGEDRPKKKRKKRRRDRSLELDEEDFDLLEEQGVKVRFR